MYLPIGPGPRREYFSLDTSARFESCQSQHATSLSTLPPTETWQAAWAYYRTSTPRIEHFLAPTMSWARRRGHRYRLLRRRSLIVGKPCLLCPVRFPPWTGWLSRIYELHRSNGWGLYLVLTDSNDVQMQTELQERLASSNTLTKAMVMLNNESRKTSNCGATFAFSRNAWSRWEDRSITEATLSQAIRKSHFEVSRLVIQSIFN